MADTITEFINVSGKKLSDVAEPGLLILSNSNSETSVIKDVFISNTKGRALALRVGATDVTSTIGSAKLSGTELIGAGTEVRLLSRTVPVINQFTTINWNTTGVAANTILIETLFNDSSPVPGFKSKTIATVTGSACTVVPNFNFFDVAGNFYYATATNGTNTANTNTNANPFSSTKDGLNGLYKRVGGVNGAETRVMVMPTASGIGGSPIMVGGVNSGATQKFSWDGKRYFHVMACNGTETSPVILQSYDTINNTWNYMNIAPWGPTYQTAITGSLSGLEEYVFVYSYADRHRVYVFNHVTQRFLGSYPTVGTSTAWQSSIITGKDTAGNYIVFASSYGTAPHVVNLGPDISLGVSGAPATTSSSIGAGVGQGLYDETSAGEVNRWTRSPNNLRFAFVFDAFKIGVLDFDSSTFALISPSTAFPQTIASITVHTPQIAAAEADFGEVGIRVTGIKTT